MQPHVPPFFSGSKTDGGTLKVQCFEHLKCSVDLVGIHNAGSLGIQYANGHILTLELDNCVGYRVQIKEGLKEAEASVNQWGSLARI